MYDASDLHFCIFWLPPLKGGWFQTVNKIKENESSKLIAILKKSFQVALKTETHVRMSVWALQQKIAVEMLFFSCFFFFC